MAIGSDYPSPVMVNGYSCRNCADVANATKHIDPQHPSDGPYGIDAKPDANRNQAVSFGGSLRAPDAVPDAMNGPDSTADAGAALGTLLNLTA